MLRVSICLVAILVAVTRTTHATILTNCELARDLHSGGVPNDDLSNYICIARGISNMDTSAKYKNSDGSTNYGIFQISDLYWCKNGYRGGGCNVDCQDLVKDIESSVFCARYIKQQQGFSAWGGVWDKCHGSLQPDATSCLIKIIP